MCAWALTRTNHFQEAEQKRLEEEMQKRRERIEQWRAERKKNQEIVQMTVLPPSKKWSLEDDDDEEDDPAPSGNTGNDDDELDPLDAYMNEVNETVKKTKESDAVAGKNQVALCVHIWHKLYVLILLHTYRHRNSARFNI